MDEWMQTLVAVQVDNLEKDLVRIVTASAVPAVPAAPAVVVPVVVARVAAVVAVAAVQAVGVDAAAAVAAASSEVTSETLPLTFRHFLQSTNKERGYSKMLLTKQRDTD